ncbi:hypothetical protein SAMN02982990_00104 [Photorhabdus luminescens]|uniref:Uncharacterized protein n=1 Tax=Photorhabdus luminescens TaxID=29488 RepID=A0A1G5PPJ5_PHOLU|nr:hypothetical protein SAMN02982990_00104 [Photorhabdus luminescens]
MSSKTFFLKPKAEQDLEAIFEYSYQEFGLERAYQDIELRSHIVTILIVYISFKLSHKKNLFFVHSVWHPIILYFIFQIYNYMALSIIRNGISIPELFVFNDLLLSLVMLVFLHH